MRTRRCSSLNFVHFFVMFSFFFADVPDIHMTLAVMRILLRVIHIEIQISSYDIRMSDICTFR